MELEQWQAFISIAIVPLVLAISGILALGIRAAKQLHEAGMKQIESLERRLKELKEENKVLAKDTADCNDSNQILKTRERSLRDRVDSLQFDLKQFHRQIENLEDEYKGRITRLMNGINILMEQIQRHESRPDWKIPEDIKNENDTT